MIKPTLATFTQNLETASMISGTESQWTLPDIDQGGSPVTEVRLEADALILEHLKYDSLANLVIYDGKEIGSSLQEMKLVNIEITLVNSSGENKYSQ